MDLGRAQEHASKAANLPGDRGDNVAWTSHNTSAGRSAPWGIAIVLASIAAVLVFFSSGFFADSEFESESLSTFRMSRRILERNLLLLNAFSGYYEASPSVSYESFLIFASKALAGREGVAGIGWVPVVPSSRRAEFESWVSSETSEPYSIFNMTLEGKPLPTAGEDTFYPIAFLVPRSANRGAIGLNITSRGVPDVALKRARAERRAIGTSPIRLAQEKENQLGTVLYHPIFSDGPALVPGTTVGDDGFRGVVFVAFRMDDTLLGTMDSAAKEGLEVLLSDISDEPVSPQERVLARVKKTEAGWVAQKRESFPAEHTRFRREESFFFAGRSWSLTTYRPPSYALEKRLMESGVSFVVVFFSLFLLGVARRQSHLRERERERLAVIEAKNEVLRAEILKRTAVQKENEILAASVEESPDIVKIADEHMRLVQMNKAGRVFFRLSEGFPLTSFEFGAFHTEESRRNLETVSIPVALQKGAWKGECTVLDATGRPQRMSSVLVATRNLSGQVKNYALILRDLPEHEFLQRKLSALTEDVRVVGLGGATQVQTRDEFLALVSRELRSPLTSILGGFGLRKEDLQSPEHFDKAQELMERNTQLKLRYLNDLVQMLRIVGGHLQLEGVPLDVRSSLAEAINLVQVPLKKRGISLTLDDRTTTRPYIMGDAPYMTQVFWNLLLQAVKHTPVDGAIVMRVSVARAIVRVEIESGGVSRSPLSGTMLNEDEAVAFSLVRHIVECHEGTVEMRNAERWDARTVSCVFPLSPFSDGLGSSSAL